jgi:hypothetical protein
MESVNEKVSTNWVSKQADEPLEDVLITTEEGKTHQNQKQQQQQTPSSTTAIPVTTVSPTPFLKDEQKQASLASVVTVDSTDKKIVKEAKTVATVTAIKTGATASTAGTGAATIITTNSNNSSTGEDPNISPPHSLSTYAGVGNSTHSSITTSDHLQVQKTTMQFNHDSVGKKLVKLNETTRSPRDIIDALPIPSAEMPRNPFVPDPNDPHNTAFTTTAGGLSQVEFNAALQALSLMEAEIEKQFQICQQLERRIEMEKVKYLKMVTNAEKKREDFATMIEQGGIMGAPSAIVGTTSQNGNDISGYVGDFVVAASTDGKSQTADKHGVMASLPRTVSDEGSALPPIPPSALDALAILCANEESRIGKDGNPEKVKHSIETEDGDHGPMHKKMKVEEAQLHFVSPIDRDLPSSLGLEQHRQQFNQSCEMTAASGLANATLKVPYRVSKPRVKKLPTITKPKIKKKHAITASRMKSNRNLQLPTHELERALYGITGGGTRGGAGPGPGNDSNGDGGDGLKIDTVEQDAILQAAQNHLSSSSSLLSEQVTDFKDNREEMIGISFSEENWSTKVTVNDVLCGRGGLTNNHPGNVFFRSLVRSKQESYLFASKRDKALVAHGIVDIIRNLNPPGRFLKKKKEGDCWIEIGNKKAREKTSQALREKAPELMELLQKDFENQSTLRLLDKFKKGGHAFGALIQRQDIQQQPQRQEEL